MTAWSLSACRRSVARSVLALLPKKGEKLHFNDPIRAFAKTNNIKHVLILKKGINRGKPSVQDVMTSICGNVSDRHLPTITSKQVLR